MLTSLFVDGVCLEDKFVVAMISLVDLWPFSSETHLFELEFARFLYVITLVINYVEKGSRLSIMLL